MDIALIESALHKSLEHVKQIKQTNSLFGGIVDDADNKQLHHDYAVLAGSINDVVNFVDMDISELAAKVELNSFHANKLKSESTENVVTITEDYYNQVSNILG